MATIHLGSVDDGSSQPKRDKRVTTRSHGLTECLHVLRHSFISCLAAAGIDQRVIDDIVGHTSEEMRRRYRHLTPQVKSKAVLAVFG
ncbi:MAG: tyrosine-type recombinase/integrase [Streptosporangiaceae bacterium]